MLVVVFYGSELNYFCDPQTTENKQMQTVFKMMCFTNIVIKQLSQFGFPLSSIAPLLSQVSANLITWLYKFVSALRLWLFKFHLLMSELKADDNLCNLKNPPFHLKRPQLPIKIRI